MTSPAPGRSALRRAGLVRPVGCVARTLGETLSASLPGAQVGAGVRVRRAVGGWFGGEVATVDGARVTIVPYGPLGSVAVGGRVELDDRVRGAPLGFAALGRAIDAAAEPLDGGGPLRGRRRAVERNAPAPQQRRAVGEPFCSGVRSLDGMLTIGRGARIGFFGAPGAGKTTLLETIAAQARGDAVVLGLIGERGREAHAWLGRCDRRTTLVCATSDRSAAERIRAADVALAQARLLCESGLHVVLILDSLARYCAALREQRVGIGETVGRGGYPPSVWAELARLLESAGSFASGSITLLATVLSDGADEREPLSDAARSLLDGHIVLSWELARSGRFPAIDVLASTSRTMDAVVDPLHAAYARTVRAALALLERTKDARELGLAESTPALAAAVAAEPELAAFLYASEPTSLETTRRLLHALATRLRS